MEVITLYRPTTYVKPVLKDYTTQLQFESLYTGKELRDAVVLYIRNESLECRENKRFIR